MSVTVQLTNLDVIHTSPKEMAALSANVIPVAVRVPGANGEGFDLLAWYSAATAGQSLPQVTHLIARAADEFEAVIPWAQLQSALLQFADNGQPLSKGPLRLYVPDGTSACLNVKSVVSLRFVSDPKLGDEARYGFRNEVSQIGRRAR